MTVPQPPAAQQVHHTTSLHGETLTDPYYWLRNREDPEVLLHLVAENEYTQQVLAHTESLQEQLYEEMRGRIKETDVTVPVMRDGYYYYSRTEEGKQYPIYMRRRGEPGAEEELLLDQNELAEASDGSSARPYCRLGAFEVSPSSRLLAYSVDTSGNESYTLYVKNLDTGELLTDRVPGTYYGLEWANDNRTLYYTTLDDAMRPYKLLRHSLGTDPSEDVLVHHETDGAYFVCVAKTRSRKYILLTLESATTTEVWYAPADSPDAEFRVIQPRQHELEYTVHHHGDRFLIVTNHEAKNFKLVETPITTPSREHWRDLIPHRSSVLLDGIDAFAGYLAIYEREGGLKRIRITDPRGSNDHQIQFPEPVYTFVPGPNPEFETSTLRFTYNSLVTPNSVVDYEMGTRTWELRKQDEIPSGYDLELYGSERLIATTPDGAQVPISLVYKQGLDGAQPRPLLLQAYGSYGSSSEPSFSTQRLSLLDRGITVAIAHVRGGSELGRDWYEAGKLLHKKNTFKDFIACAEHLIAQGYTSPDQLAIVGRSAGGLLMGAVVNLRPELFRAVIAGVPFVDVINTMTDPSLPLTVTEYEEWGNPTDRTYYDYMRSYSPYENIEPKDYPHILATAGLNDPRVSYWEPAKWVARLRATKTDGNPILLKTNTEAGHGGPTGRYDYLKETAFEYAFLLDALGVTEAEA